MPLTRSAAVLPHETTDASVDTFTTISDHHDTPVKATTRQQTFVRNTSSPIINTTSTYSETSSLYGSQSSSAKHSSRSSSGGSSNGASMRVTLSSSSSFASPFSYRKGRDEDDSDEDDEHRFNAFRRGRLGGCSQLSEAQKERDDSNKENVAPLRRLSQGSMVSELSTQQHDTMVRRTRRRPAAPMSDRCDSQNDVRVTTPTRRSALRRTVSTPSSTRKRGRPAEIDDLLGEEEMSFSDLPSPSTRPRLDSDDQESCYFSSQATSIFDLSSSPRDDRSPFSRCTTPEPSELDVEEAKAIDTDDADETVTEGSAEQRYSNIFVHARALLRTGVSTDIHIVGRDRERGVIQRFLQSRFGIFNHLEHSAMPNGESMCPNIDGCTESGSMYVCGLPGTGKTALVRAVLADVERIWSSEPLAGSGVNKRRVAFIDCMAIQHPRQLFKRVLATLGESIVNLPAGDAGDAEAEKRVVSIVRDARQQTLIVLDEIDHLLGSRLHQNILYRLFSWPQRDTRTCAVIGLANSLDLTERFVPLLASKGAAPSVLHFRPFEAAEIKQVVGSRLAMLRSSYEEGIGGAISDDEFDRSDELNVMPLFSAPALELMARKIAAATGDLRKALDTCRLAVETVENETVAKASDAEPVDLRAYTPTTVPKVMPAHILKVLSAVLGSPQLTKIRSLALQPKLALLALLVAQKRAEYNLCVLGGGLGSSVGPSSMGGVYASNASGTLICDVATTYIHMLKNDDFAALESKELMDVLEGLEVEGIVRIVGVDGKAISETACNGGNAPGPSERMNGGSIRQSVSPSAKRAAKRQLLASYRRVQLVMSADDVVKGITTPAPPSRVPGQMAATSDGGTVVLDALKRIWSREEFNAERARGWQASKALAQRVRDEELGGGRGALGQI